MQKLKNRPFALFLLCLVALLALLFLPSFNPNKVHFSNDGPLGVLNANYAELPSGFTGVWFDLNAIGYSGGSNFLSPTYFLFWMLGPLLFAKFYVPIVLAIVGLCAWFCFRQLKFTPIACLLGALAAVLNSSFFSATCWGVGPHVIAAGMSFFAIGILSDMKSSRRWLKVVLAGFAVGLGVMEGFDLGAIYSMMVAAFVVYQALVSQGTVAKRAALGFARLAVVAICAGFLAFQAITGLISTQIKGVAGMQQDEGSKAQRWDQATQWSLPKREAFSLIVPGLFGFRMDTPAGGNYWGAAGRDAAWERYFAEGQQGPAPQGFLRYTGGGNYLGVIVALVALWCALQALRKDQSLFPLDQRKPIWFWSGAVIICLLLAFGRYAPFYQVLYALPYFSTIRNPAKFLHILSFSTIMLFAYGMHALTRRYVLENTAKTSKFGAWFSKASRFDKRWVIGSGLAVGASLLAWLIYGSSRSGLERYLQTVQFDETSAQQIARFSLLSVGWFILLLILSAGVVALILSGRFTGQRAKWAGILVGLLLCIDLGLANQPWIKYWNWRKKYATDPIVELLRKKPYEQRVAVFPMERFIRFDRLPPDARPIVDLYSRLNGYYRTEWAQHHFQYYNIQSLDVVQMPRRPIDLDNFEMALGSAPVRRWELTNTRYFFAPAHLLGFFNQQLDPIQKRFRVLERFDLAPKPGEADVRSFEQLTAVMNTNGDCAVFEFAGALPRAHLYSNWLVPTNDPALVSEFKTTPLGTNELQLLNQIGTNDFLTLRQLTSPSIDPAQTVLLAEPLPGLTNVVNSTNSAGTVEFVSYAPKQIKLRAKANGPSVLLLNDKFDPNWKATLDGKPERVLRCNYIMRGVQVPAGEHQIEFRFEPPRTGLKVSLAAIILGLALTGFTFYPKREDEPVTKPAPVPEPLKAVKR